MSLETGSDVENVRNVKLSVRKVLRQNYIGCKLTKRDAETLAVIEVAVAFDYKTHTGSWTEETIKGLLVVGKGAVRARGVDKGLKQLDFIFEARKVALHLDSDRLEPEFKDFEPKRETGFGKPVVELLTHTYRPYSTRLSMSPSTAPAGRYHCGLSFHDSYENIKMINEIRSHPSSSELLPSYQAREPIDDILHRLVVHNSLEKSWFHNY